MLNQPTMTKGVRLRNYQIRDLRLILLLKEEIADLFWILQSPADMFDLFVVDETKLGDPNYEEKNAAWGELYENSIIEEKPNYFLMRKGFLEDFGKYIITDWNQLAGVKHPEVFKKLVEFNKEFVKENCDIFLSCVDGAYWDVFVRNPAAKKKLADFFVDSEEILICDCLLLN
ncbi:hypothetical protein HYY75_02075 [bacterium]|nr:hypothetical protein [bacterium]